MVTTEFRNLAIDQPFMSSCSELYTKKNNRQAEHFDTTCWVRFDPWETCAVEEFILDFMI